jgi:hypothetical protein
MPYLFTTLAGNRSRYFFGFTMAHCMSDISIDVDTVHRRGHNSCHNGVQDTTGSMSGCFYRRGVTQRNSYRLLACKKCSCESSQISVLVAILTALEVISFDQALNPVLDHRNFRSKVRQLRKRLCDELLMRQFLALPSRQSALAQLVSTNSVYTS